MSRSQSTKVDKLIQTQHKLEEALKFLQNYLPLANVHSNDFILQNVWEKYLSENIRHDLDFMTDEEILNLPQKLKQYTDDIVKKEETCQNDFSTRESSPWNFSSEYLDAAPKVGKMRKFNEIPIFPLKWKHESLEDFLRDAAKCTLMCSSIVSSVEDLYQTLRGDESDKPLIIPNFMSSKKSHEVNIMSDTCSLIAKTTGIDVIVDMGSGKGYLSTQLVYQHGLCVVGVDAQTINTSGAQKRAALLGKQWSALVKQAEEQKIEGTRKKRSKKQIKKMKKLQSDNLEENVNHIENSIEISGEVLTDLQFLLHDDNNDKYLNSDKHVSYCTNDVGTKLESFNDKQLLIFAETDKNFETKIPLSDKEKCLQSDSSNNLEEDFYKTNDTAVNNSLKSCDSEFEKEAHPYNKEKNSTSNRYQQKLKLFNTTMYVNDDIDILDLVKQTGLFSESRETTVMLTGLHTCGSLGSSLQNLFLNSVNIKVLCYVSCCYHLMDEEFVAAPFNDGHENGKPGFPLSSLLKKHEVGLGRAARNFASQTLHRSVTELKAKSYPRCLLQKILYDIVGHVDSDWKGLRKLDQKCATMFEYVKKAFEKLKLPSDQITPHLVSEYCDKYKEEERKLAIFLQIKSILAPCIEAVVLLDRYLFLLEQECVRDALLVQMFDPVTSPRCHAIVAFKEWPISNQKIMP